MNLQRRLRCLMIQLFEIKRVGPLTRLIVSSKIIIPSVVALTTFGVALWIEDELPKTRKDYASILFQNAESIAIISAAATFLMEFRDRQKRKQYEAWGVINSAKDQSGNGGRIQALQDLNFERINLEGITAPDADLSGIDLHFGKLKRADFQNSQLDRSNLHKAFLPLANFSRANLCDAKLHKATLDSAILNEANLQRADLSKSSLLLAELQSVNLRSANLQNAILEKADLSGASLWKANLQEANFEEASLQSTSLRDANFRGANLRKANLKDARNWTDIQLGEAKTICKCILPEGSKLDPNRDCTESDAEY